MFVASVHDMEEQIGLFLGEFSVADFVDQDDVGFAHPSQPAFRPSLFPRSGKIPSDRYSSCTTRIQAVKATREAYSSGVRQAKRFLERVFNR